MSDEPNQNKENTLLAEKTLSPRERVVNVQLLRVKFPFLSSEDALIVTQMGQMKEIPAKAIFIQQNFHLTNVFFVIEGRVEVLKKGNEKTLVFGEFGAGSILGDLAVSLGVPSSVSARALVDTTVLSLDSKSFFELIENSNGFTRGLLAASYRIIQRADRQRIQLCGESVVSRVYQAIAELPPAPGTKLADQIKILPVHAALARNVGSSREVVTRSIKLLAKQGLITVSGKSVMISRPE